MFVKPAKGRTVRWPGSMLPLAEAGENVPETTFWLRRVMQGDVEQSDPPEPAKEAEAEKPAEEPSATDEHPEHGGAA